ncbi:MAG TPA: hypothetical protein VI895_02395 [Bdellovibrionota bacterium]|nr:hypothetical protein [Bdellovibrionota bacterium]
MKRLYILMYILLLALAFPASTHAGPDTEDSVSSDEQIVEVENDHPKPAKHGPKVKVKHLGRGHKNGLSGKTPPAVAHPPSKEKRP